MSAYPLKRPGNLAIAAGRSLPFLVALNQSEASSRESLLAERLGCDRADPKCRIVFALEPGGIDYHVLSRRLGRLPLFDKPADYTSFEKNLVESDA
jgi:hypothetical protein